MFVKKALALIILVALILAGASIFYSAIAAVNPNSAIIASKATYDTSHRGHAPEPSTLALMGSGILAGIVRFARRRFAECKRVFDIIVSVIGLVISFPVLLFSILIIKLTSPGPALFRQKRVGKDGDVFEMLKLRTMLCNAEQQTGPVWAKENDPRVTPFGRCLRMSRIDEIPQLVNVLRGDMSIIGPRPERPEFVETLAQEIGDYPRRLAVRPGITGLAQIKQSYDETIRDVRRKVKFDLLYIKRMCFFTDFRILLGTFSVVLTGRGAR